MLARAAAAIVLLAPALAAGVELTAGAGVGSRRLFYKDVLTPDLRGYEAQAFPVLTVAASAFPLRDPSFGEVGLEGRFTGATGLNSRTSEGRSVPTGFQRIEAGAALRLFSGAVRPALSLRYGTSSFSLDGNLGPSESLPAYDYAYARLGGELGLTTGIFRASIEGAYLAVLSAGALADRFSKDEVRGVDAAATARIRLASFLEAGVRVSYTHFAHAMHPLAIDALVAGGALDQYLGAVAEVVLTPVRSWILLMTWALLAACPGKLDDPCFELACDAPTQVFEQSCEASICHRAGPFPATAGGLDLASPGLESRIRNKASECPGMMVFNPAHPEQSSLFLKTGQEPPCKEQMPYAGMGLSDKDRLCLLSWLKWEACKNPP